MIDDRILILHLDGYGLGINALDGYAALDTFVSAPVPVSRWAGYSISVSCPSTGTPVGTWKLQGCNDLERRDGIPDALLVNWFDIVSGGDRVVSQAVSSATVGSLSDAAAFYRWVRVKYTRTSGTITATVKMQRKTYR